MVRLRAFASLFVLFLLVPTGNVQAVDGPHFGRGHIPDGCSDAFQPTSPPHFTDACYHMRVNLNALDTPIIDVLLVPPASPWADRDLRVMHNSVEMWRDGIQYMAPQLGLGWLKDVQFHVAVQGDAITTDPLWDPKIVVVLANPAVTDVQGIGIDPLETAREIDPFPSVVPIDPSLPCRGANPAATIEDWLKLPGFDHHHGDSSGTFTEKCQGGGTVCYAVNVAIDPAPGVVPAVLDINTFDLVSHEFGHCLSAGHVGNAGDHTAAAVPGDDIMSYDFSNSHKCVSSLDVEAFALRMSRFLLPTPLVANDAASPAGGDFVVQHPKDLFYASSTGLSRDCVHPDDGILTRGHVDFTPHNGTKRTPATLTVTSHVDGQHVAAAPTNVTGTVFYDSPTTNATVPPPGQVPSPNGTITGNVVIFSDLTRGLLAYNELAPIATGSDPQFLPGEPVKFHSRSTVAANGLVTVNVSTFTWHVWDASGAHVASTPCTTIADSTGFDCPGALRMPAQAGTYYATAQLDGNGAWIRHTGAGAFGVKRFQVVDAPAPVPVTPVTMTTTSFHDGANNTFQPTDSSLTLQPAKARRFTLPVTQPSRVVLTLSWDGLTGTTDDLDLFAGAAASAGVKTATGESILLANYTGNLAIRVDPVLVTSPTGVHYQLVAQVTPLSEIVTDPCAPPTPAPTCVARSAESVAVKVDGVEVATQDVDGRGGQAFSLPIDLTGRSGDVTVTVTWYEHAWVVRETTLRLFAG